MAKRYAIWQAKHWWPLLLVFTIIISMTAITAAFTLPIAYEANAGVRVLHPSGAFIAITGVSFFTTFIMPFFVYSYRTKRQYVDTYYQADLKEGSVRKIRLLIGLFFVLAPFIASYILGFAIHALRYAVTPDNYQAYVSIYSQTLVDYVKAEANYIAYLPAFFLGLVTVAASYAVNCFLVSLGDYVLDQVFLLLFGTAFLALVIISPYVYFLGITRINPDNAGALLISGEPVGDFALLVVCDNLFGNRDQNLTTTIFAIVGSIIHVALGVAAFLYCYKKKDPSGENADSRGARNSAIAMIPHLGALAIGILIAYLASLTGYLGSYLNGTGLFLVLSEYVAFALIYYCLLALWRHSWKPTKLDLISYLSTCGMVLLFTIIGMIMNSTGAVH